MKSVLDRAVQRARDDKEAADSIPKTQDDQDILSVLEASKAKIKVFGVGGAGCNTIARLRTMSIEGAQLYTVNTDAQALLKIEADKKILIGKKLTRGLGAGSNPQSGEAAAQETKDELVNEIKGTDLIFVTCGLGGGTGTGAAPVIAEIAKEQNCLTVGVVTLPFTVEGKIRMIHALEGLAKLRKHVDTVIVIPNDKILELAPDLPLDAAFNVADEVLSNAVKGITEMITKTGLINLDFADLKTILTRGGPAMIGLGESDPNASPDTKALQAAENALTSPLLDVEITKANRALINVVGGADMSLKEAQTVVEAVASRIDPEAHIIFGAMIDPELHKSQIQAMVVIVGGHFPYLDETYKVNKKTKEVSFNDELDDIDYTG